MNSPAQPTIAVLPIQHHSVIAADRLEFITHGAPSDIIVQETD